ncbi:hypothetical protein Pcinc_026895 [Petrolisthes cinctipes]|uniref:Uncharacterized protein n=1 Tax=Petrolisthes cinctipes TaxID=88211 RepID=A0AAE1K7H9_PETCI|nr:hypothetical protein Pcinc_026895 [Petrolisthes cinctipes]
MGTCPGQVPTLPLPPPPPPLPPLLSPPLLLCFILYCPYPLLPPLFIFSSISAFFIIYIPTFSLFHPFDTFHSNTTSSFTTTNLFLHPYTSTTSTTICPPLPPLPSAPPLPPLPSTPPLPPLPSAPPLHPSTVLRLYHLLYSTP